MSYIDLYCTICVFLKMSKYKKLLVTTIRYCKVVILAVLTGIWSFFCYFTTIETRVRVDLASITRFFVVSKLMHESVMDTPY